MRVAEEIAAADLITCKNVLTEITAAGPEAEKHFLVNMRQVIATMGVGASLLCSDYAGYPSSLELLRAIRGSAQRLGKCVTDVETTNELSRFADVRDRRVTTAFYSEDQGPHRHMHTASLLIRKI